MAGDSLGNLTKSASAPSSTGVSPRTEKRWARWSLMEAVRVLNPEHRASRCGEHAVPGKAPQLRRDVQGRAYYANVRRCGCVWVCPFCASKVGRGRVEELKRAVDAARAKGYTVTLATFTVGHRGSEPLAVLLRQLTEAMRWWRSGREWQRTADALGYIGAVRNLEVTWGEGRGWHPHSHALLITRRPFTAAETRTLQERWVRAVEKFHGYAGLAVGLKLSDSDNDVAGYLAKAEREVLGQLPASDERRGWGAAEELVWSHVKRGREGRFSPWDLLRLLVETGWAEYADRWQEYVRAFHGKRQLYWSKGLREELGLGREATDEELAEAEGEAEETLWTFAESEWRRLRREGLLLVLLDVAEEGGQEAVGEFMGVLMRWSVSPGAERGLTS
jgi:hypothetical protein